MKLLTEATTSFELGIQDSATSTRFRKGEAYAMTNFRIAPDHSAEVRYGSRKAHAAALNAGAQCFGLTKRPFTTTAGVVQWIAFFGDSAYYSTDEGETWTLIASLLRQDYWSLATMRVAGTNYLLCVNGGTTAYKWDGATWSVLANVPSGAKVCAVFNERFYVAGHSGSLVQGSKIGDPEVWTLPNGLAVQVQTHDGDTEVVALFQIGSVLLAFKRSSVAYINGFGYSDIIVAAGAVGLSRSVGCLGRRTVQAVGDQGLMWLSDRGIEFYQPGGQIKLMSERVREFMRSIPWDNLVANLSLPDAVFVPGRNEYWCALPGSGNGRNNLILVHNTLTGGTTFFQYAPESGGGGTISVSDDEGSFVADGSASLVRIVKDEPVLAEPGEAGLFVKRVGDELELVVTEYDPACLAVADRSEVLNDAPIYGGYDGFLRYLDEGETDNAEADGTGGVAIGARLRPPPRLFGKPFNRKWGRVIRAMAYSPDASTVTLALLADGVERSAHTVTIPGGTARQPRLKFVRTSAKGYTLQEEIRTSKAGLRISAVSLDAQVLKEAV
jgi:hypothetical protein